MSSKRKSPPSKLATDELHSGQAHLGDNYPVDSVGDIDDCLRESRIDDHDEHAFNNHTSDNLLETHEVDLRQTSAINGNISGNRYSSDHFQDALEVCSEPGIDLGLETFGMHSHHLSVRESTMSRIEHDMDSYDSLTSDGGLEPSRNSTSSRKRRLLQSVSSARSETSTDSENESECSPNGSELLVDNSAFARDFLSGSPKRESQFGLNENNHRPMESAVVPENHNQQQHQSYPSQVQEARSMSATHSKRSMDDVLKRLTSKITTSASLKDRPPSSSMGSSPYNGNDSTYLSKSPLR